jgi:hypothetical protein
MSLDVVLASPWGDELWEKNITHNLAVMARYAGLYEALWRPEELGITHADQNVPVLLKGIKRLVAEKEYLLVFSPENGWGNYDNLLNFALEYLQACLRHPKSIILISR